MNTELLLRVRDHILAEPRRLNMSQWRQDAKPGDVVKYQYELGLRFSNDDTEKRLTRLTAPPCGTVACIAGWSVILSQPETKNTSIYCIDFLGRAETLLGITDTQSDILFYPRSWPEPFRSRYPRCHGAKARARLVAKVIDTFIAKDGNL